MAKQLGDNWKALQAASKAPFEELARVDKERHKEEMKTYVPPDADSDDEEGGAKAKAKPKPKAKLQRAVSTEEAPKGSF